MAKSEYTYLTYFMIYGYKLVKKSDNYFKEIMFFKVKTMENRSWK